MTTTFINPIEKGEHADFGVFVWHCVQAMMPAYYLRELNKRTPTWEDIEGALGEGSVEYHRGKLAEAERELATVSARSTEDWQADLERYWAERLAEHERAARREVERRARLMEMRKQVQRWEATSEELAPLKQFMLDQLDLGLRDERSQISEKPTLEGYRANLIEYAKSQAAYHKRELDLQLKAVAWRRAYFTALRESVPLPVVPTP